MTEFEQVVSDACQCEICSRKTLDLLPYYGGWFCEDCYPYPEEN